MFCFCFGGNSDRLKKFINKTKNRKCSTKEEFDSLFEQSRELVFDYMSYYDKKRLGKKRSAGKYKFFIWLFSLIGLSLPVLSTAFQLEDILFDNPSPISFAEYGYGFIMLAAIIVALKNFTGASKGHARYTKTQLKLERLISLHTLDWKENLSLKNDPLSNNDKEILHKVIMRFLHKVYIEILSETNQWDIDMNNAEKNFLDNHLNKNKEE